MKYIKTLAVYWQIVRKMVTIKFFRSIIKEKNFCDPQLLKNSENDFLL